MARPNIYNFGVRRINTISGTKAGGLKARATNTKRYGEEFYSRIGQKGGKVSRGGGFASDKITKDGLTGPERARLFGALGGILSVRGKAGEHKEKKAYTRKPTLDKMSVAELDDYIMRVDRVRKAHNDDLVRICNKTIEIAEMYKGALLRND